MKRFFSLSLCFILVSNLLLGCQQSAPTVCQTCNGTGKVFQSKEERLPFQILNSEIINTGLLNPDYIGEITIENKGDKDGTFKIFVDFVYNNIGTHTEQTDIYVRAHSTATKSIRYDADKFADEYEFRVEPPSVVMTTESICPTCGGRGNLVQ